MLERLKPKFAELRVGRLRRVLRTAMPLQSGFELSLNGSLVESSKEDYEKVVQFEVCDLPQWRLDTVRKRSGRTWHVESGALMCDVFPTGVRGSVFVTEQTLLGKSSDLLRSEGFFVFVRGRLVNEEDSRFGLHELSHATLNRFRANIQADDLDDVLTANRESIGYADSYEAIQLLLNEVFNEARQRFSEWRETQVEEQRGRSETTRDPVPTQLVEQPTADALSDYANARSGADPDESWMYLAIDSQTNVDEIAQALYTGGNDARPYRYTYARRGQTASLVAFDPLQSSFTINQDHALMTAYGNDAGSQRLFQDFVTAEALLEVYLLEAGVSAHVVGEVLQKRNRLLQSLANDHMSSVAEIAHYLVESADSSLDLEIALVAGARVLGFVAMHIGGSGEPDGLARFMDYPGGERKITLEAKSSTSVPPAKDIDFASLVTHREKHDASGILLLAPGYMGDGAANTATAARRDHVSCWTVDQFAQVVAAAEKRHLSARQVLEIVERAFAPDDVSNEVNRLLGDPVWTSAALYAKIVRVLGNMKGILSGSPRTVGMIAPDIAREQDFEGIGEGDIFSAVSDLAGASQGGLILRDNGEIVLNVEHEELARRVSSLTRNSGMPRRRGSFSEA